MSTATKLVLLEHTPLTYQTIFCQPPLGPLTALSWVFLTLISLTSEPPASFQPPFCSTQILERPLVEQTCWCVPATIPLEWKKTLRIRAVCHHCDYDCD